MTTYTLNEATGIVTRDDGTVVCPAQSDTDVNFLAYTTWLGEGNTPNIIALSPNASMVITRRAFRARFTMEERVSMDITSIDNPSATLQERQVSAAVRTLMKDVDDALFIDLQNPSLVDGMAALVQFGIITQDRATAITTAPITQDERP